MQKDNSGRPAVWKKPGRPLKPTLAATGYLILTLKNDASGTFKYVGVHNLVALAFYGARPSPKHQALHKDDCKTNNHYLNIRWGTPKQNGEDMARNGRSTRGVKNTNAKLTEDMVREMRSLYKNGVTFSKLAKIYGLTKGNIAKAVRGETWGHVC